MSIDGRNMLKFALELAKISHGHFDPTVIDMLESIGYTKASNTKS
jgi:thiamine biosynthesis lipoprotein ApbE